MACFYATRGISALAAFLSLVLVATGSRDASAGPLYVSGSGNEFGTLNLTTGAFTEISNFNLTNGGVMFAMGTAGAGTLTGVDFNGEAYFINAATGATTDDGNTGTFPIGGGGSNSILYTFDAFTNQLLKLDFSVAQVSVIGTYNFAGDGLVVAGANGIVYVAALTNGFDDLYAINTATGIATDLGSTGDTSLFAGAYVDGKIYGFDFSGNIVTLSATTGAATFVHTYSLPNGDSIYAAAYVPSVVPEPSSLTLMGLGIVGVAGVAARRRHANRPSPTA